MEDQQEPVFWTSREAAQRIHRRRDSMHKSVSDENWSPNPHQDLGGVSYRQVPGAGRGRGSFSYGYRHWEDGQAPVEDHISKDIWTAQIFFHWLKEKQ